MRHGSRAVWLVVIASACQFANFQILLPVGPVVLERAVGHRGGAGLANASLLLATVVLQLASPALLKRFDHARLLGAGLLLMGLPSVGYVLWEHSLIPLLLVGLVRGAGFGITTVTSAAMVVELVPLERRGAFLGHYGLASALPAIVMPPLGLSLLANGSLLAVAALGVILGIAGWLCLLGVAGRTGEGQTPGELGWFGLAEPGLRLYGIAFIAISIAWGGTVTFLPVALPIRGLASAAAFLLVSGILRAVGRFVSGYLSDLVPAKPLLVAAAVVTAAGLALLPFGVTPVNVLLAAALYGLGSGSFQTTIYVAMLQRVTPADYPGVSALWNTSIDLGGVIAAVALGGLATVGGYPAVLVILPLMAAVAVPAVALVAPTRALAAER